MTFNFFQLDLKTFIVSSSILKTGSRMYCGWLKLKMRIIMGPVVRSICSFFRFLSDVLVKEQEYILYISNEWKMAINQYHLGCLQVTNGWRFVEWRTTKNFTKQWTMVHTLYRQTVSPFVRYNIIQVCHFISKFSFRFVNVDECTRTQLMPMNKITHKKHAHRRILVATE